MRSDKDIGSRCDGGAAAIAAMVMMKGGGRAIAMMLPGR